MPDSPAPVQPIELTDIDPLADLAEFERAFVLGGTRAEFNRASRLLLPFVNHVAYEFCLVDCDCPDLQLWYVRDEQRGGGYFYGVCHAHRLQPLGRATRCPRLARSDDGTGNNVHRRRKSGATTTHWYHARRL